MRRVGETWKEKAAGLDNVGLRLLAEDVPNFMAASRAPRSVQKYSREAERWESWAKQDEVCSYPADPFHIVLYVIHRTHTASSPSPVVSAVYGLAWAHHMRGLQSPTDSESVQRALQSARRQLARTPRRKEPITMAIIQSVYDILSKDDSLSSVQTLALIVLGYAGFFRWDDLSNIYADELQCRKEYMAVFLEGRKNDQFSEGSWVVIARWASAPLCPVALTEELLRKGSHTGHVKLFRKVTAGAAAERRYLRGTMTYGRARELMRESLERAGVSADKFGLHSLRSGGVSAAAAAGVPDRLIRRQGGWRSETSVLAYFKESLPNLKAVSTAIQPK